MTTSLAGNWDRGPRREKLLCLWEREQACYLHPVLCIVGFSAACVYVCMESCICMRSLNRDCIGKNVKCESRYDNHDKDYN